MAGAVLDVPVDLWARSGRPAVDPRAGAGCRRVRGHREQRIDHSPAAA